MRLITLGHVIFILVLASCSTANEPVFSENSLESLVTYFDQTPIYSTNSFTIEKPIFFDQTSIELLKVGYINNDSLAFIHANRIIDEANYYLGIEAPSVTNRLSISPGKSINDYVSMAPYWWPDPDSADGPYIRLDGNKNPEVYNFNRNELGQLRVGLMNLAIAYYLTDENKYADHAVHFLNTWFISENYKMNPHLKHSQHIPNMNKGRFLGIIDGIEFSRILDTVYLLRSSRNWSIDIEKGLVEWFKMYNKWLVNSEFGKKEKEYHNNHGSWYDVQVLTYSYALHSHSTLDSILRDAINYRIEPHISFEGIQTNEVSRTLSLHYSTINIQALLIIAEFGQKYDYDFWNYPSEEYSKLDRAINYLYPSYLDQRNWTFKQIKEFDSCRGVDILQKAFRVSNDSTFVLYKQTLKEKGCTEWSEILLLTGVSD